MEENAPNLQLQEPSASDLLLPAQDYTLLWLAIGGFVFLVLLILIIRACIRPKKANPIAARKAAYLAAKKALDAVDPTGVRETAVETSLIIRRFLADAVADPSLFETHEEFLSRHDSLKRLTPPAREACSHYFTRIARLKYAPEIPADEPSVILTDSRALLEALNGGFLP